MLVLLFTLTVTCNTSVFFLLQRKKEKKRLEKENAVKDIIPVGILWFMIAVNEILASRNTIQTEQQSKDDCLIYFFCHRRRENKQSQTPQKIRKKTL